MLVALAEAAREQEPPFGPVDLAASAGFRGCRVPTRHAQGLIFRRAHRPIRACGIISPGTDALGPNGPEGESNAVNPAR
jgi:hypothetical protein